MKAAWLKEGVMIETSGCSVIGDIAALDALCELTINCALPQLLSVGASINLVRKRS
jgi:hypothetical protein